MWPAKWTRAPDKTIRFGDMPVMLWLQWPEYKAICGHVEIACYREPDWPNRPPTWRAPITGVASAELFWGYSGKEFNHAPTPAEFEEYVLAVS